MSNPRFDEIEGEDEEMGAGRAALRGLGQVPAFGLADEAAGYVDAATNSTRKVLGGEVEASPEGLSQWFDDFVKDYRTGRDEARSINAHAREAEPAAFLGANIAGNVAAGAATGALGLGAGLGLGRTLALGAGEGALGGLGGSDTDLTTGDVEEYVRALGDTGVGAAWGAGGAGVGYGAGRLVKALGSRGTRALDGARTELVDEAAQAERQALQEVLDEVDGAHGPALEMNKRAQLAAQRAAEREADRLARAQGQGLEMNRRYDAAPEPRTEVDVPRRAAMAQQEALERAQGQAMEADKARAARYAREQGQGLEMDKRYDARASAPTNGAGRVAREVQAQGLQRSAGIPEPRVAPGAAGPLPNGRVRGPAQVDDLGEEALVGYERKAYQQVRHQADKVREYEGILERGEALPGDRTDMRRYADLHRGARENPAAARRGYIRQWIAMRYGDEAADSLMQRFDEAGRYIPTGNAAQDAAGAAVERHATQVGGFADEAAREGLSPEDFLRQRGGGGGSALDGLHNADTQVDVPLRRQDLGLPPAGRPADAVPDDGLSFAELDAMGPEARSARNAARVEDFAAAERTLEFDPRAAEAEAELQRRLAAAHAARQPSAGAPTRDVRPAAVRAAAEAEEVTDGAHTPPPAPRTPTPVTARVPAPGQAALPLGPPPPRTPAQQAIPVQAPPPRSAPPGGSTPPAPQYAPRLPPPGHVSPAARVAAQKAEAGAGASVAKAAYRGFAGARNGLAAPLAAAVGVGREALRNPAVRARALAALRVQRLARQNPALYARVGASLAEALGKGPEEYAVTRHVLLQTEPEYRQAEAQADAEDSELTDEEFFERLAQEQEAAAGL